LAILTEQLSTACILRNLISNNTKICEENWQHLSKGFEKAYDNMCIPSGGGGGGEQFFEVFVVKLIEFTKINRFINL